MMHTTRSWCAPFSAIPLTSPQRLTPPSLPLAPFPCRDGTTVLFTNVGEGGEVGPYPEPGAVLALVAQADDEARTLLRQTARTGGSAQLLRHVPPVSVSFLVKE
jgi:hypothetical protein